MEKKLELIWISDENSYKTFFINAQRVFDMSDSYMIEDILHIIADEVNRLGGVNSIKVDTFRLVDQSVSDIPDSVDSVESLKSWYFEQTGEEIEEGW